MPDIFDYYPERSSAGDFELIFNLDVIYQHIRTVLTTPLESRPFVPTLGSNIYRTVWEQFDDVTKYIIEEEILSRLNSWVPYVSFTNILVQTDQKSKTLIITIQILYQDEPFLKKYKFTEGDFLLAANTNLQKTYDLTMINNPYYTDQNYTDMLKVVFSYSDDVCQTYIDRMRKYGRTIIYSNFYNTVYQYQNRMLNALELLRLSIDARN